MWFEIVGFVGIVLAAGVIKIITSAADSRGQGRDRSADRRARRRRRSKALRAADRDAAKLIGKRLPRATARIQSDDDPK
jgi:hypothetical protein